MTDDRRATDNMGLNEMAGEVVNQTFVLLTNSRSRLTVCASKSATSLSPEPLCVSIERHPAKMKPKTLKDMKTFFLTLTFALTTMLTFAQTSEHLSFKGVPIDGTLDEYVSKMKQNGFTHLGTEDGTAILNGDFAGYKDCHVGVSTLKQKDLVYKIGVLFPEKDTWSRCVSSPKNSTF